MSVGGAEIQFPEVEIANIVGTRGTTCSGRMFALKYTPTVLPTIVNSPQAEEFVCVPTTPYGEHDSSSKSAEATVLKGKDVIIEKKQVEKIVFAEEGHEFLKLIK